MTESESGQAIPMDPADVFKAISNGRRRQVIRSLARAEDLVPARELAVEIAARENGVDPNQVTSEQRTRVYIALTQVHLMELDELGAAEYDSRSKQVGPTEATNPLARQIRRIMTACYPPPEERAEPDRECDR